MKIASGGNTSANSSRCLPDTSIPIQSGFVSQFPTLPNNPDELLLHDLRLTLFIDDLVSSIIGVISVPIRFRAACLVQLITLPTISFYIRPATEPKDNSPLGSQLLTGLFPEYIANDFFLRLLV